MQTPQYQIDSLEKLQNLSINASGGPTTVLGGIANITRSGANAVVSQYDIQPMVQIFATTQDRDLGAVAADIRDVIAQNDKDKPKGSTVALVGQVRTMYNAYFGPAVRTARRDRADLFPDRGQLPVVGRSVRDHHRAAGRARRHRVDAVRDAHHAERARTHRRDHVHGRRDRQLACW